MTDTYFFQFSQGCYSDYSTGGLFICDHEVTKAEWDAHYKAYMDECHTLINLTPRVVGTGDNYRYMDNKSQEWQQYVDFKTNNNPEQSFQKLHNMVEVECTELWRD